MTEVWKPVVGYEELYEVSNKGFIKSLDRFIIRKDGKPLHCYGRLLKFSTDRDGYKIVGLTKDKKLKQFKVHRVVAEAFIPNPNNLPCINHKDENPANNCVDNLEWCDSKYNNNYGTRNEKLSKSLKIKHAETHYLAGKNNPMYGKKHSKEAKQKMKEKREKYWSHKNTF